MSKQKSDTDNFKNFKANFAKLVKTAPHVPNDLELKTEMGKQTFIIVSDDEELYHSMIQRFPKRKISQTTKKFGNVLTILGLGITIGTGGILSSIGLPLAGIGLTSKLTGGILDDYKHYEMFIDYNNKKLIFCHSEKLKQMMREYDK